MTAARQARLAGSGGDVMPSPKKGDVVHYENHQWTVHGVTFGPEGIRLVLECAEGGTALARPRSVTLVGEQLELIPEEPT